MKGISWLEHEIKLCPLQSGNTSVASILPFAVRIAHFAIFDKWLVENLGIQGDLAAFFQG